MQSLWDDDLEESAVNILDDTILVVESIVHFFIHIGLLFLDFAYGFSLDIFDFLPLTVEFFIKFIG